MLKGSTEIVDPDSGFRVTHTDTQTRRLTIRVA